MTDDELIRIKRRAETRLFAIPGVHAVGLGSKEIKGHPTGEPSIRVFVVKKKPPGDVPPDQLIPPEIDGVKTDVVEMALPKIKVLPGVDPSIDPDLRGQEKYRPLIGGTEISRVGSAAGTLGCFCTVNGDNSTIVALTCHHNLYRSCSDRPNHEKVGQPTGQESWTKCCSDVFGTVLDSQCDEDVDVSLVQLQGGEKWVRDILDIGPVRGINRVTLGQALLRTVQVKKRGMISGLTGGLVIDAMMSGNVYDDEGRLYRHYVDAIYVQGNPDPSQPGARDFSLAGDSGSAVLNTNDEVIGILFGGGPSRDFVTPIQAVIDKFATGVAAPRQITLAVATATTPNDVQTIPGPSAVAGLPEDELAESAGGGEPRVLRGARLQLELAQSQPGRLWSAMYHRHSPEIRGLLETNRRFATLWHRGGGAALFQCLVRAFHNPELRVPQAIGGRTPRQCADALAAGLLQFGSPELKRDLRRLLPHVPDVAGRTYAEILGSLGAPDPTAASQTA